MALIIERRAVSSCLYLLRRCFTSHLTMRETMEDYNCINSTKQDISINRKKSLNVAILGAPNAGKSTLINQLVERSICPASSKVHTTRRKACAIYTEDNVQLVFIDTPGVVYKTEAKKFKLNDSFCNDPVSSFYEADVVGIVQDVSNVYTRNTLHPNILDAIQKMKNDVRLILILNKIDKVCQKSFLLELTTRLLSKLNDKKAENVFMISALSNDGVNDLKDYLLRTAKEKDWQYLEDTYTDQPLSKLIEDTTRSKLMDTLPQELPYTINVCIEHLERPHNDNITASIKLECRTSRIASLLLRGKNRKVKSIAIEVEDALRHAFRTQVKVIINVTVQSKNK